MARRKTQPARHDNMSPQQARGDSAKESDTWSQHEHVAPPVQTQAQQLLNVAGSPELAHHAVDQAAEESVAAPHGVNLEQLAQRWGFRTKQALLAASLKVISAEGNPWWATPIEDRGWVVWNELDPTKSRQLTTLEEARAFVAAAGGAAE